MKARSVRETAQGQMIVIAAGALVAIVIMVGLVIDGGTLFAQQRNAQNGADAASTAGTLVIASNLGSSTDIRTDRDVYAAVNAVAVANGLAGVAAVYTDDVGQPIGADVTDTVQPIPAAARGVRASGSRAVTTTFSRVMGFDQFTATAEATVVAGKSSGECVLDLNGCTLLPVTFPVQVSECDSKGNLIPGNWIGAPPPTDPTAPYWPIVGAESLPSPTNPTGDTSKMAILPLCRSSSQGSGAFGWLDLDPNINNLANEITGPLTVTVDIPDWFQTQPGNPNSVDDELSAYIHKPVLIPLNNGACRVDPGGSSVCPAGKAGTDPVGNNTWYYVHTLATFFIDQVHVQGSNTAACASAPGTPTVPSTAGGFLGCLKGWFINYVTSGPVVPGGDIERGKTAIAIQLIK